MKARSVAALLGLAGLANATPKALPRDFQSNDYYVIHLDPQTSPSQVAWELGLSHEGLLGELKDHHIFSGVPTSHDLVKREVQDRRRRKRSVDKQTALDGVLFSQKQQLRKPWEKRVVPDPRPEYKPAVKRTSDEPVEWAVQKQADVAEALDIHDPIFTEQWHLFNPVQVGHDVNVTDLWLQGITGTNATVAIVDDGLDMYSEDLRANYYAAGSYDFNDKTDEPKPRLSDDRHGTRCAGEVSAVRNDVCGVGVAYDSKIAGLRILSKLISDADEAVAMNYDFAHNQIYSCSWGPPDDGRSMEAPGILIRRAMLNAVQNGRGGLGSIYVFASGNGAANDDNCNFDGYTNSIYSITVGAIDRQGQHPYYSEKCSAGLVVTYSSGAGDAIHTTDVGPNNCYDMHGGTSAAAPLAAGLFALALQVRPDLTWRDMQYLAMMTAVPVNEDLPDEWQTTTIGRKFSHTFGYGKIDSFSLVEAAKTWQSVKPQAWLYSPWIHVNEKIPQGEQGIMVSFEVTADMLADANLARIEHVTVTMNINHTRRGDLSVDLISPDNIISHISTSRKNDNAPTGYNDWTFMSVVHWGESGLGTWTIVVKDEVVNEHNGTFTDWHLKLWGESLDASKAVLLPMPTEDEDKDHALTLTTTIGATTTTLPPNPAGTQSLTPPFITPTDHPDRPVNSKPTGTEAGNPDETGTPSDDEEEAPSDDEEEAPSDDEEEMPAETPSGAPSSSWLPSFLPTFGVSSRTQVWIYGAVGLIAVFCCGLGVYLWLARRRRLRNNPRSEYEFELLEEDEEMAEGLNGDSHGGGGGGGGEKTALNGGAGGKRRGKKGGRRTRGGELYDAFAGGSDEEDGGDDEFHDDGGEYHDRAVDAAGRQRRRSLDDGDDLHVVGEDSEDEDAEEEEESGGDRGDERLLRKP